MKLTSCPKGYTHDLDKATDPAETVQRVRGILDALDMEIVSDIVRIDNGRLGIPVFMSIAGAGARDYLPTRKQMGKGATPAQAEASALMELMERYGFFTFWSRKPNVFCGTWAEAKVKFADALMPIAEILQSVNDTNQPKLAEDAMNLLKWHFFPVLDVNTGKTVYAPLDWFKKLSEFNGSSAGNTDVESILQGACELVERHVCCIADETDKPLPTIDQTSITNEVLLDLLKRFSAHDITIVLKDFSMGMPVPTVAALAYDKATFPLTSEIVYTAGTASTPEKAAIRAVTEVAQLAGDFCTSSCYEASGLAKLTKLEDVQTLEQGELVAINTLPSIAHADFLDELNELARKLWQQGFKLYSTATTNPVTQIPTHYSFVPGFKFRERDKNASVGLFVGRILAEEMPDDVAVSGLAKLKALYPAAHYIPFFEGLLALRNGDAETAEASFLSSEAKQPDNESKALAAFYAAYAQTMQENWSGAVPALDRATALSPEMKEYFNLRGVCYYKQGEYANAALDFEYIIRKLDRGSVMDIANLGVCNKFMGNKEQAEHYLNMALELEPGLDFAKKHLDEMKG